MAMGPVVGWRRSRRLDEFSGCVYNTPASMGPSTCWVGLKGGLGRRWGLRRRAHTAERSPVGQRRPGAIRLRTLPFLPLMSKTKFSSPTQEAQRTLSSFSSAPHGVSCARLVPVTKQLGARIGLACAFSGVTVSPNASGGQVRVRAVSRCWRCQHLDRLPAEGGSRRAARARICRPAETAGFIALPSGPAGAAGPTVAAGGCGVALRQVQVSGVRPGGCRGCPRRPAPDDDHAPPPAPPGRFLEALSAHTGLQAPGVGGGGGTALNGGACTRAA